MGKKLRVDGDILFFAFRYALGRRTYVPSTVVDNIKANIKDISTEELKLYINGINQCADYGMKMDEDLWLNFVHYLEEELKQR